MALSSAFGLESPPMASSSVVATLLPHSTALTHIADVYGWQARGMNRQASF